MTMVRRCAVGHPTTERQEGQRQLPCGCVFETATAEALVCEFRVPPDAGLLRYVCDDCGHAGVHVVGIRPLPACAVCDSLWLTPIGVVLPAQGEQTHA
jgi:hypothetical protein